jgi:serine/threonine protein kinase/WD40 repeat protein
MVHERMPIPDRWRTVEDLFDAVRELPPSTRQSAIDAGTDDLWVRAEVRSLLQFDGNTTPTLGSPRSTPFDAAACIGMSFGGFTLRELIGTGGMGAVFAADQEMPARRIAVKILHASTVRPSLLARFRKESDFLAQLDHPNIARVIAAGTMHMPSDGSVRPYFAMDIVDGGRPITQWATEHRASREEIARTFAAACDAVGSGHRRGIVHLDLKPSNILVSQSGVVRVIDYGIARSVEGDTAVHAPSDITTQNELSAEQPIIGTPQYMSPEQFGRSLRVDSRADVYALGLILYELLTRALPYETRGRNHAACERLLAESKPVEPWRIDSTVPHALGRIALKAMQHDPSLRYGTAAEIFDDIKRWLSDEPIIASPETLSETVSRFIRKNRRLSASILLTIAAILVGGVLSFSFAVEARRSARLERSAASRANLRSASAALSEGEPAEAARYLARVAAADTGWDARHLAASLRPFELLARIDTEILRTTVVPKTGEIVCTLSSGFVVIVNPKSPEPYEIYDIRPFRLGREEVFVSYTATSSDGRRLFTSFIDTKMIEIDRDTRVMRQLPFRGGRSMLAGARLVVFENHACSLYDRESDALVARLDIDLTVSGLSVSRDCRMTLIGTEEGSVIALDVDADGGLVSERWRTPPYAQHARAVALAPDGSFALVAWRDGRVARLSMLDGSVEHESALSDGPVFELAISPDGTLAAASSWTNTIRVLDCSSLQIVRRIGGTLEHVWGIAFSNDGHRLYARCVLSDTPAGPDSSTPQSKGEWLAAFKIGQSVEDFLAIRETIVADSVTIASCGPDADLVTFVDGNGAVKEVRTATGEVHDLGVATRDVTALHRSTYGLLLGDREGNISRWTADADGAFRELWNMRGFESAVTSLGFSPDGSAIACGSRGREGMLLESRSGKTRWRFASPPGLSPIDRTRVTKAHFLDAGEQLTFSVSDGNAKRYILRALDGVIVGEFESEQMESDDAALLKDGSIICLNRTGVVACESLNAKVVSEEICLNGGVLTTSKDERHLFTATRDGSLRVSTREQLEATTRTDLPIGIPLAITLDEERDELSVLTSRGILRTWIGRVDPLSVPRPGMSPIRRILIESPEARTADR